MYGSAHFVICCSMFHKADSPLFIHDYFPDRMRSRLFIFVLLCCGVLGLSSCGISKEEYQAVIKSRDSLQLLFNAAVRENSDLRAQIQKVQTALKDSQTEYNTLADDFNRFKQTSSQEFRKVVETLEQAQAGLQSRDQKINEAFNKLNDASNKLKDASTKLQDASSRLTESERQLKQRDSAMNALKTNLDKALFDFRNKGLNVDIRNGKVYVSLSNQLLFKVGSTTIDKQGQDALAGLAQVLQAQTDVNVLVEGHTDIQAITGAGRFTDNWDLSVLRSTEVVRYLTRNGVEPQRVTASGRGEFSPLDSNKTPEAYARNRRTDIVLTPNLQSVFEVIKSQK